MKIRTWIKYEESYLPKRCRKLRYKECEDYVYINLKEVNGEDLQLAFEDNSYNGKGKIYYYKGKLWSEVEPPHDNEKQYISEQYGEQIETALDWLIWNNEHGSQFFLFSYDRENNGIDTSREAAIKKAKDSLKSKILVDEKLYETTAEPRYVIITFGLGHNHGGTGMFCEYFYNPNISKNNYFSALDGDKAVAYANYVAQRRGDTKDVGRFEPFIITHIPELVKIKPKKQHGNGDPFMNQIEDLIVGSSSVVEAGLLTMMETAATIAKQKKEGLIYENN